MHVHAMTHLFQRCMDHSRRLNRWVEQNMQLGRPVQWEWEVVMHAGSKCQRQNGVRWCAAIKRPGWLLQHSVRQL